MRAASQPSSQNHTPPPGARITVPCSTLESIAGCAQTNTVTDSFDKDFGVDEWHGTNAFIRDGEKIFRTYFINNRGDEQMGNTWNYLDITALGRQEEWEDSPEGYPQTPPYKW